MFDFAGMLRIFTEYDRKNNKKVNEIKRNLKNNFVQELQNQLRNIYPQRVLKVDFFKGVGGSPDVPWISIMDKSFPFTTQSGYYIVFLISKDLKKVYLNIGCGTEKFSKEEIDLFVDYGLSILGGKRPFVDLASKNSRPRKYERGSITSEVIKMDLLDNDDISNKFNKVMTDYIKLLDDIDLDVYYDICGKTETSLFVKKNSELLDVMLNVVDFTSSKTIEYGEITQTGKKVREITRDELDELNKLRKTIGNLGEEYVLSLESERLIREGIIKEAKVIAKDNENAGYDIISFEKVGGKVKELFIEVKTTVGKESTKIFLSEGELSFSRNNADNYKLVRVSKFDILNKVGEVKEYRGAVDKHFKLKPTKYTATVQK